MEYIKFKNKIVINDILEIIKNMQIRFEFNKNLEQIINGISNGLYQIDHTISFIENITDVEQLRKVSNSLILTNTAYVEDFKNYNVLVLEDCRYTFIKLVEYFKKESYLHKFTTSVHKVDNFISVKANIHLSAVIEEDVIIEEGATVSAGCILKTGTFIGKNTIIRENCTIGCDGITLYKAKNGEVLRFPHIAGVYIGENVEIGANCVVVKGNLFNTSIGDNTVIGNLTNIGHGAIVKNKVWISVGGLIGGNTTIDNNSTIGLGVSFKDRLVVGENVTVGMGSVVTKSVSNNTTVFGNPAKSIRPLQVGPNR